LDILALIIAAIAFLGVCVGGIWLIVLAFKESFLWGCGYLVVPFVWIFFVFKFWEDTKKPFLIGLGSSVVMYASLLLSPTFQEASTFTDAPPELPPRGAPLQLPRPTPPTNAADGAEALGGEEASAEDLLDEIAPAAGTPDPDNTATADEEAPDTPGAVPPPALPPPSLPTPREEPRRVVGPPISSRGGPAPESRRRLVEPTQAERYIGRVVEVVTIENQHQRVILTEVNADRLEFNADGLRYTLPIRRIRELWILNPE
jgi:hypothetical protein